MRVNDNGIEDIKLNYNEYGESENTEEEKRLTSLFICENVESADAAREFLEMLGLVEPKVQALSRNHCPTCGAYMQQNNVRRHQKRVHGEVA